MNLNGRSDGFGGLFVGHDLFMHWGDDQRSVDKRRLIEMQGHSHRLQLFEHDVTFLRRSQVIGFFGRWNRRVQVDILDLAQISEQSLGGKGGRMRRRQNIRETYRRIQVYILGLAQIP